MEGICRAQPPISTALVSAGVPIRPLHGQGAFLGEEVPVYDDARLIRGREAGEALAEDLGSAGGIIMRGNGAVSHTRWRATRPPRLGRPDEYAALAKHIVENEVLNGEVVSEPPLDNRYTLF